MNDSTPPEDSARSQWIENRSTFQRVYDYVVGSRTSESAATVADQVACSEAGARSALEQLVEMGIATAEDTRPRRYRRNESYFEWKRIEELADQQSPATLRETVAELLEEDDAYQQRFGVPDPDAVSPETFESVDHDEVQERLAAVSDWRTVRRDITLLQRAIHRAEESGRHRPASA